MITPAKFDKAERMAHVEGGGRAPRPSSEDVVGTDQTSRFKPSLTRSHQSAPHTDAVFQSDTRRSDDLLLPIIDRLRAEHERTGELSVDRVIAICERRGLTGVEMAQVRSVLEQSQLLPRRRADVVEGWSPPADQDRLGRAPDLLGIYLAEIGAHELLMPQDEIVLGRRIRLARDLVKQLNGDAVEFREFLSRHQARQGLAPHETRILQEGAAAEERMFVCNLRLVVSIARSIAWQQPRLEPLDVVQAGNLGLARAIQKFDHTLGYKFSTYATWWIKQAVHRYVADYGRMVRLPVHIVGSIKAMRRAKNYLTMELGRPPTLGELSEWMSEDPAKIQFLEDVSQTVASLDRPAGEDGDSTLLDYVVHPSDDIDDALENAAMKDAVDLLLDELDEKSRTILELRFGLGESTECLTLEEIGHQFCLTRERIRQIEAKALKRLADDKLRRLVESVLHTTGDEGLDSQAARKHESATRHA